MNAVRISACGALLGACVLAACGGNSNGGTTSTSYAVTSLVSNGAVAAAHTDANLTNPWGIAFEPSGPVWVANNHSETSTLYDGTGAAQTLVVTLPNGQGPAGAGATADPTGIVLYS